MSLSVFITSERCDFSNTVQAKSCDATAGRVIWILRSAVVLNGRMHGVPKVRDIDDVVASLRDAGL